MSVIFDENVYRILRNNDPAYQAMTRVSDANNTYDIRQRYVKIGSTRNDFSSQLANYKDNRGILSDGTYIDMTNFFIETERKVINGKETVVGRNIPYFKFKTNSILNYRNSAHIKGTYIDKVNVESIYDIEEYSQNDNVVYVYSNQKTLIENQYNSYPLQRVDKLVLYELDSLFVYIDGKKIPDNKIFIYSTESCTDVLIPQEYIPGDIEAFDSNIDTVITVDYRQPGSEGFHYFDKINSSSVTVDLSDRKYLYAYEKAQNRNITKDKILAFVDGYIVPIRSVSIDGNNLTIEFNTAYNGELEFYILNNVIYRYKKPTESMMNPNGSKVLFYINDDYKSDIISGPITKNAVSFWYEGKRVDDSLIIQNSRYSFELSIDQYIYDRVSFAATPVPIQGQVYYILNSDNKYESVGTLTIFESNQIYFIRQNAPTFNEEAIDFIIEDIDEKVNELGFKTYGDDYYLLNMLGVKRCVDKMKGTKSYSIFDDQRYNISFKNVLSNNGDLFDVQKAIDKYNYIGYNTRSPNERIKRLLQERPPLMRKFLEQIKNNSKRFIVLGNSQDVTVTSVDKITNPEQLIYYKIYVNHNLIESSNYSTKREGEYDYITIKKEVLDALVYDQTNGSIKSGRNEIEIFQSDLSYKEKLIFKDNINNGFESFINTDGSRYYEKTYNLEQLPFTDGFTANDLCAVELIKREWFDYRQPEANYIYADENQIGYRAVKLFQVVEKTATTMTIRIMLHDYDPLHTGSNFYIMHKEYNIVERIIISNLDNSYMETNDLLIPVYSTFIEYGLDHFGNKVIISSDEYMPYINTSEPVITCGGKELIYGKDYVFSNPEKNDTLTTSFIILKQQMKVGDELVVQFNSNKTNILIVGYDDLEIDNRYGLVYLSELKYPVSPEYMNIFINGEKLSAYDIDILSDKLIRVHHISRPIKSILVTTNTKYKDSEIQDFLQYYHASDFENLLSEIFYNCDPSKQIDANKPGIDYVYKVNPYYSEFVGEAGENYNNSYYETLINTIIENGNTYNETSVFSSIFSKPVVNEEDYELKLEAWDNAYKFFEVYKTNHGFVPYVDSVLQAENPYMEKGITNFITDTLEIMYINWLCKSGKTRSYNFKDNLIDPLVLKYFSVFENIIINDSLDIVVDSNRFYDGLYPDVCNDPFEYNCETGEKRLIYPGAEINAKRRFFFNILLTVLNEKESNEDFAYDYETQEDKLIKKICNHKLSNILYPCDQPLEPDKNGIIYTGSDLDIVNFDYEEQQAAVQAAKDALNAATSV